MIRFFRIIDANANVDMLVNMDLISTITKTSDGKAHIVFLKTGSNCPSSFTTSGSYEEVLRFLRDVIK